MTLFKYKIPVDNILIIRTSSIGDIVMASPMIRVLRHHYPDAHLGWLVEPPGQDLLRHNPGLDEVIVWPKKQWAGFLKNRRFLYLRREIREFSHQLRKRNYDLALDAQGLLRNRWLAWMSGAKERWGFESKEPGRFLMTKIHSRGPHTMIMGSEYHYMMQVMGLDPGPFHPEIAISPEDEYATGKLLKEMNIGQRYAVFAPFTTRPQKHWFEDRWVELAQLIHGSLFLPVVILGGKEDLKNGISIEKKAQGHAFSLAGRTSLGQGAAIIKNSSLLLGVDTGLTHVGAAFDCPTVALFGATCPYLHTYGNRTFVIYNPLPCSPCRRNPVCKGDFTCMKSIKTGQVFNGAQKLLKEYS